MAKVQRNYKLDVITPEGKQITIEPPFTLIANIARNTLASANKGNFTIYNLGENTRNQIFKDRFTITEYWQVILYGGYGNRLHELFKGNMLEGFSYKQGSEWITKLDCFDGMQAIQNGFTSTTIQANTPKENILKTVINDMPNVIAGLFGSPAEGEAPRGQALIGQSSQIISEQTGDHYFIDGETINVLNDNETLPGAVIKLDPGDLLATPRRREAFLDVPVLFEPQVQVGRVYEIESLETRFNGQYKIVGFSHNVPFDFSGKGGQAITNLQLYFGADGLQEVTA